MSPVYPPSATPAPRPRLGDRINRFWVRVTEGLEVDQLWAQFERDARSSYRLYSSDVDRSEEEALRPGRKFLRTAEKFFWAILEKLSPARRVLLLVALVLLFFPSGGFTYKDKAGDVHVAEFDLHVWGGLTLLLVLILEVGDRVVMKRDLQIAKEIQNWLLPNQAPTIPGVEVAFLTRAANTVAGDYYDVFARAGAEGATPHYLLAVADVAGKSIPAAMLMATFQASLRTLSNRPVPLADLVRGMNQYACTNSQGGLRFTTAFIAEYDPGARALTYVNAGHNPPMVCRKSGALERLEAGGLPIGIMVDAPYQSATTTLEPGDWLVIFTDGVVEAENTAKEEYGETRLLQIIAAGAQYTPAQLLQSIMTSIDVFVGNTPQHDDITCLLVKVV
jgi:sigma-B regulation protein RsbU (phosphoserine phosphatase)